MTEYWQLDQNQLASNYTEIRTVFHGNMSTSIQLEIAPSKARNEFARVDKYFKTTRLGSK